jgi:hypothetical protein
VVRGPVELPIRSPAAIVVRGDTLDVVLNDRGKPRTWSFATPVAPSSSAAREGVDGGTATGSPVACAASAEHLFCSDGTGAVHRTRRDGAGDTVVASSRTGSRISAVTLAGTHTALGYLASRQTTEGWVSEAWLAVDDETPVRLSDEGSGATSVMLAPRKASALALMVDARAALTALHVRPVSFEGRGQIGEDVVVFVGGPGDRRSAATMALPSSGSAWALLPIARDIGTFGMAAVRVEEPAQVDEPVTWSMYPNGLDPAPVASVVQGAKTWVARARPQSPEPGGARVLEMGTVGPGGTFAPQDILATASKLTDVALAADRQGALWVAWLDATGSWLERVVCR